MLFNVKLIAVFEHQEFLPHVDCSEQIFPYFQIWILYGLVLIYNNYFTVTVSSVCQRIQFARSKSDAVAKQEGTYVQREKKPREKRKAPEQG